MRRIHSEPRPRRSARLPFREVCLLGLAASLVVAAPAFAVKRRAFVTSVAGPGNLSTWPDAAGQAGIAAGDAICRARAAAAGLPNAATYRAWLSNGTTDAYCHVQGLSGTKANACGGAPQPGGGPWYLVNGVTPFAPDLATLTGPDARIYRGVFLDETGAAVTSTAGGQAWTGTGVDGTTTFTDCVSWSSSAFDLSGTAGTALGGAQAWTDWKSPLCNTQRRLLCLEPGVSEAVVLSAWSPGALAFVTSATGLGKLEAWPQAGGQTGLQAGDAICRTLAAAAHLPSPESFVAWLSDTGADAAGRLTTNGPFRRLDGFSIASSKADLVDGDTMNSLHVDETGRHLRDDRGSVFTGTASDGTASGFDCANWTAEAMVDGTFGYALLSRSQDWTAYGPNVGCYTPNHLFCFANTITLFWDGFESGDAHRWSSLVP